MDFSLLVLQFNLMRKTKQQKAPSSEDQLNSQQEQLQDDERQEEEDQDNYLGDNEEDELNEQERDQQILKRISQQGASQAPQLQLTWNAIWALKQKEIQLKKNLNQQIEKIKNKYEMLKQPLYQQISNVALGKKIESKLYKPEGLPCRGDPLKITPLAIKDFWGQILDKEGLMKDQVDVECFSKLKQFTCEIINLQFHEVRICFTFKEETEYFDNKTLQVTVKYDNQRAPKRQIKQPIRYKKLQCKKQSIFTLLFDPATLIEDSLSIAHELYQIYSNALYFYFLQESADDEQEEQDSDDDQVQAINPDKKVKLNQKKELQKPQCKNQ